MTEDEENEKFNRLIAGIEDIAGGMNRIADAMWKRYYTEYPPPRKPAEATVTRVKSQDDLLRESQGGTDEEDLESWMNINAIGKREREYLEREKERRRKTEEASQAGSASWTTETR